MKARSKKAHKARQQNQERYDAFNTEPTEVNGVLVRSRLEALWIEELSDCEHFSCVECFEVPVWIHGPYGTFLSNYKPDIIIENTDGKILVELKPTTEMCLADDRQSRALELNPKMKFLVIGGYPYSTRITARLMTGNQEKVFKDLSSCDILRFLGCDCGTDA